jgi:hypothetical protein
MNAIISEVLRYLIDFGQYVQKISASAGSPKLSYNWLIISFFLFAVFLIGLNLGRTKVMLAILGLYIAAFLEPQFVYFDKLQSIMKIKPVFWLHIGLFLLIYLISVAILNRSFLRQPLTLKETSFFSIALIAVLEVGFLASLLLSYLPPEAIRDLPVTVIKFFGTKNARFWWAVLPILGLLFLRSRKISQA